MLGTGLVWGRPSCGSRYWLRDILCSSGKGGSLCRLLATVVTSFVGLMGADIGFMSQLVARVVTAALDPALASSIRWCSVLAYVLGYGDKRGRFPCFIRPILEGIELPIEGE